MKTYLEMDEVKRLEAVPDNLRDRLLIRILFYLGCRVSEAIGIAVEDTDFINHQVTIQHLKTKLHISCPDCGCGLSRSSKFCAKCGVKVVDFVSKVTEQRRRRILPVDDTTLGILREYIDRDGPVVRDNRHMIFNFNRHRAWQIVKENARKAGLPDLINPDTGRKRGVSPHRLRDAFSVNAVKLNDSGDGLRLLQEHLGHSSFNTTARYRKVSGQEHREWYEKLWSQNKG
jgi:integrase/recombinase XerD